MCLNRRFKMTYNLLLLWMLAFIFGIGASSHNLETIYEWKYFNVTPVSAQERVGEYNESSYFNYRKAVPFDVDASKGKLYKFVM